MKDKCFNISCTSVVRVQDWQKIFKALKFTFLFRIKTIQKDIPQIYPSFLVCCLFEFWVCLISGVASETINNLQWNDGVFVYDNTVIVVIMDSESSSHLYSSSLH